MSDKIRRTNRHHRRSRSRGGNSQNICGVPNIIQVCEKRHQAFHLLFPDTHPEKVAQVLNETYIDPAFTLLVVTKEDVKKILKHLSQLT